MRARSALYRLCREASVTQVIRLVFTAYGLVLFYVYRCYRIRVEDRSPSGVPTGDPFPTILVSSLHPCRCLIRRGLSLDGFRNVTR